MTDYKNRVDEAISSGHLWRAKEILQGRLANAGYDTELFREYAIVLQQMGDLRVAGKYFFLSGSRAPEHKQCISIFRDRDCNGSFSNLWKSMPKAVHKLPMDEIPEAVLEELTEFGFNRPEMNAVFKGIEEKRAAKKKYEAESTVSKGNLVARCGLIAFALLLLLGLYQAVVLALASVSAVTSWIGF